MTKLRTSGMLALAAIAVSAFASAGADLQEAFAKPPESAKPLTWWHWIDGRITFCTRKVYKKDEPLLPSGLLGPVRLTFTQTVKL